MFDEKNLKKEIETIFKHCSTKAQLTTCREMCYGMIFGVCNFWCDRGFTTPESENLADWWASDMLPKFNQKIAKMS